MQFSQRGNLRRNAQFVGRGIFCILVLSLLVGCHGPWIDNADTPTPRPASLTASSCDAAPDVLPVSASEIDVGDTSRSFIALTFDAGGPSGPTARTLDTLAGHHVRSTFFVTGEWATGNPDRRARSRRGERADQAFAVCAAGAAQDPLRGLRQDGRSRSASHTLSRPGRSPGAGLPEQARTDLCSARHARCGRRSTRAGVDGPPGRRRRRP